MIMPYESDLQPVITREIFDLILKDRSWQVDEIARCMEEPWYMIVNYCYTIRKDSTGSYVERVPPKEYLRMIAQDWFENSKYALSKSRQLMATWLMIVLHLRECMFRENFTVFCQTKKEEDADAEMIQRAAFVWRELPIWLRRFNMGRYSYTEFEFNKTKCFMKGIPSGADQIRSHNPNCLLSDEIAFQNEAEESYTSALACCQRITLVTSANPGWADDFYHDRMN